MNVAAVALGSLFLLSLQLIACVEDKKQPAPAQSTQVDPKEPALVHKQAQAAHELLCPDQDDLSCELPWEQDTQLQDEGALLLERVKMQMGAQQEGQYYEAKSSWWQGGKRLPPLEKTQHLNSDFYARLSAENEERSARLEELIQQSLDRDAELFESIFDFNIQQPEQNEQAGQTFYYSERQNGYEQQNHYEYQNHYEQQTYYEQQTHYEYQTNYGYQNHYEKQNDYATDEPPNANQQTNYGQQYELPDDSPPPPAPCAHYAVLGVEPNATLKEIQVAYRKLVKQHHPDKNGGDENATDLFLKIQQAYETLGDDKQRATYDATCSR